jgi:hypothetical protein
MEINENNSEFNFLYERLIQILENSAFMPLEKYNSYILKKCDKDKSLNDDDLNKIINVFNHLRTHYIEQIKSEISRFMEKYGLKDKLKVKSEAFFYELMIKELGIGVSQLEEIEEINSLDSEDTTLLKFFLNRYTNNMNSKLSQENASLKNELENLRKKNLLNL